MRKTLFSMSLVLALGGVTAAQATDRALKLSKEWQRVPSSASLADAGKVVFPFGETLHTITCAPLRQCDIQLQPGEKVNNVKIGDKVRWKIEGARSGPEGAQTVHLVIKPTQAGLATSLVITTDRRAYHLQLKSMTKSWMPTIGFTYPEESDAAMAAFLQEENARQRRDDMSRVMAGEGESLRVEDLDFAYEIDGETPWRPTRVFSDGAHTYVDLAKGVVTEDAPVLLVKNAGGTRVVNYRVHGRRYIVDGVFATMELVAGVGSAQQKVTIKRASR
jgi:type IV secretion system protein VirB9